MRPNPHPVPSSVRKFFIDFFARPNSSVIGNAEDGSFWRAVRGAFKIFSSRADTNTNPSEYPMATQKMPYQDVDIQLYDIDNGSAAALWVTDAGNWYAVGIDQHPLECNCDTDTECSRWNARTITGWTTVETGGRNPYNFISSYTCTGGNSFTVGGNPYFVAGNSFFIPGNSFTSVQPVYYNYSVCTTYIRIAFSPLCVSYRNYFGISRWTISTSWNANSTGYNSGFTAYNERNVSYNSLDCNANFATGYNAPTFSSFINGYNAETCAQYTEFKINCETCYPQYIRFIQSVGNTVSTLFSKMISPEIYTEQSTYGNFTLFKQDNPLTRLARSMRIFTKGDEAKISVYAEQNLVDNIDIDGSGEIVYTPTGVAVTPEYGIMIRPSEYNQQSFIGGIIINPNQE